MITVPKYMTLTQPQTENSSTESQKTIYVFQK